MKQIQNILTMFKETSFSLFSDGKISMKRVLSFLSFILVAWGFSQVILTVIPPTQYNLFEHCFDGILMLIGTLLIGATWQDIKKSKQSTDQS